MEDLDAGAAAVRHRDPPVGADGDGVRLVELPLAHPLRPKGMGERTVGLEDLNAVVAGVRHDDPPIGAKGDVGRVAEA